MHLNRRNIVLCVVGCVLLCSTVACRLTDPVPSLPTDAPTPTELSAVPTFAPIVTVTPSGGDAVSTATITPDPCTTTTSPVNYELDARLDVDAHTASATLKATYHNTTGHSLDLIVFNVEPNRKPGIFTLTRLDTESAIGVERFTLTGPRLEVALKSSLEAGCKMDFNIGFTVQAPPIEQSFIANTGYFGYTPRQFNLSKWMPEVAPYNNGQWITPESWALGEYSISALANYTATVKVRSKTNDMLLIGPGTVEQVEPTTWHFKFDNARSFTLAATNAQDRISVTTTTGIEIDLYYFPAETPPSGATRDPRPAAAAKHALETARLAVDRFSNMYGDFPYKRLVVVEADFPDGMEFSGMVFVGSQWFTKFDNKPDSWLTLITAHEVSHQWWYSEVGNNQAEAPFLDEGLALYSEYVYMQTEHPSLAEWWWQFRVRVHSPQGKVDSRVYDFQNLRMYLDAVYLRGALMLEEIREAIGDEAFFKWLRSYRDSNTGGLATMRDFWLAMDRADYDKIAPIRAKYLRVIDPLEMPTPVKVGE